MQPQSQQSVSPALNCEGGSGNPGNSTQKEVRKTKQCECSRKNSTTGPCGKAPKVTEMLKQSLAVLLIRVRIESGQRTAEKILDILRDEYFDLADFQNSVTNLEQCERITENMSDNM